MQRLFDPRVAYIPEGGSFGRGEICNGEVWHNKIAPHCCIIVTSNYTKLCPY